jgi:hypothetical protein
MKRVPILELNTSGLMGGVENGKWITPAAMARTMGESPEFLLVGWKGVEEGGVTLGKKMETEDVCQDFVRMELELQQESGVALGTVAKWRPVPRIPQEIGLTNEVYKKAIADYLKTKGIVKTEIKLTQAYRVDLEGDGTDEVLLTATYYKGGLDSSPTKGDYSVILLRKAIGKTVVNYLIAGDCHLRRVLRGRVRRCYGNEGRQAGCGEGARDRLRCLIKVFQCFSVSSRVFHEVNTRLNH